MKVKIQIDCDNAAFDPDPAPEVCRILNQVIRSIRMLGEVCKETTIHDVNGNVVGRMIKTR